MPNIINFQFWLNVVLGKTEKQNFSRSQKYVQLNLNPHWAPYYSLLVDFLMEEGANELWISLMFFKMFYKNISKDESLGGRDHGLPHTYFWLISLVGSI